MAFLISDNLYKNTSGNTTILFSLSSTVSETTELYFSYESVGRLKNERDLAIQMSRDDNNKIYSLTRQEYDAIINYMVIYGQYLYLQKWIVESIIKKCNDIEILKTHKDKLDFKVNPKQINNLVKMTPEKRQEYFTQMANNIK